jgi:uncharacterized membrane protein
MNQSLGQILRFGVMMSLLLMVVGKFLQKEFLMWLGVVILVFLPVFRVAWVGVQFYWNKEVEMAWISALVLALLLGSFFLGHA